MVGALRERQERPQVFYTLMLATRIPLNGNCVQTLFGRGTKTAIGAEPATEAGLGIKLSCRDIRCDTFHL
jgi:hypothetical protein